MTDSQIVARDNLRLRSEKATLHAALQKIVDEAENIPSQIVKELGRIAQQAIDATNKK